MDSFYDITTAARTSDLTTLETVKRELKIENNDENETLTRYIREASNDVTNWIGRPLAQVTVNQFFVIERHKAFRREPLPLCVKWYPIVQINQLLDWDGTLLVEDVDYEVDFTSGRIWRISASSTPVRCFWSSGKITVDYIGGYALLDDLPYAIEEACIEMVKYRWHERGRDPMVRSETVVGVETVDYWVGGMPGGSESMAIPGKVTGLLEPYREVRIL
jgi:hypothetical protein